MKRHFPRNRRPNSFTLVELLVVLAIIALLGTLLQPAIRNSIIKAQSTKCMANLRTIGNAAQLAATDNNNLYPQINQTAPPLPYPATVGGLVAVLGPYGITTNGIQCPVDLATSPNSFTTYGSSYEWNPAFDDENPSIPVVYFSKTAIIPVNNSRVRLCQDFNSIHHGRNNALYGDGHVSFH
jgi:prepilin-type N-terminal cleavage/methylation domain-containing protein/prepilin-type processing-associated H-X9-DG protein